MENAHARHGHSHEDLSGLGARRLLAVILFNAVITVVEYVAGVISGSLALISDAGHNFSDVLSLALGYAGERISRRKPSARYTFGLRRFEILVALLNALTLAGIGVFVAAEAAERFRSPTAIRPEILVPVALVGLFGNVFSILVLRRDRSRNLNLRAAFLHLLYDALSSVAVLLVGIVLWFRPWTWLDLVLSLGLAVVMIGSSAGIILQSLRVFLQAVPDHLDLGRVRASILRTEGIGELHGLHVWSVDSSETFLSCHVCLRVPGTDSDAVIRRVNEVLEREFGIVHTTIQVETARLCVGPGGSCCPARND